MGDEGSPEGGDDPERVAARGDSEIRRSGTVERERDTANSGNDPRHEDGRRRLERAPARRPDGKSRQREEGECGDRRQQSAEGEEQPAFGLAPHHREEPCGQAPVDDGEAERDVPERQDGHGEREGEPEPRVEERGSRGEPAEPERPAGGEEREHPCRPARHEGGEDGRHEPRHHGRNSQGLTPALTDASLPAAEPERARKRRCARPPSRVEVEGAVDRGDDRLRQVGT